jgi:thioredoxin-like negative regulator of GroEL
LHLALASVLVALLSIGLAAAEESEGIHWSENIGAAQKQAAESGKPVMVDIWAVWCVPCKEMDETTYRDGNVIHGAEAFVPLKVDADVKTSFIERYDIDAFPTLLFLDGKGREITRWRGAIAAEPLGELMQQVGDGYGHYLDALKKTDVPDAAMKLADYFQEIGNADAAVDHLRASLKSLKNADPAARDPLELRLCQAQVAAGSIKSACKSYARLAESAAEKEIRGQALLGLAQAETERGNEALAGEAIDRLKSDYPEVAATAGL